ncbi:MAG: Asp-tRNA(Asn)/Glu-tRNA(Gln) amidotransferase subunit GatB [Clostridia bacterium]|nr:Asp-tRNA(Asn)/Glu-tRNA(Gln) amidotransferase subunit GatB [Clostridia bacterium]
MEYETVIGLEVHSELNTATKCFCGCKNEFGAPVNTNCCPICIALPGALPIVNSEAVKKAILMGLAVGCKISNYSVFERKNYFYPDLAKAYQISQAEYPLCIGGGVEIDIDGGKKYIRLNHIHLEEDAAKLIHTKGETLVDYNRGGVPLIEMVSEPDMNSADEAVAFLEKLRTTLLYAGVSDCKMQEGSIKCDVNVSVHQKGKPLGTRVELKNLNSFRAVHRAIEYESSRQIEELEKGGKIFQETRRWDDERGISYAMRSKEDSQDYRYFPDPDIVPISVSEEYIASIKRELPRLAEQRKTEYLQLGLTESDADLLTAQRDYADFFEGVLKEFNEPKFVCNWITAEVFKKLNTLDVEERTIPLEPKALATMLKLYKTGEINQAGARKIFDELWENGGDPVQLVDSLGLKQMNDSGALEKVLANIIETNPKAVQEYRDGNEKIMAFFVGQAMKATSGKANPKLVAEIVKKLIK